MNLKAKMEINSDVNSLCSREADTNENKGPQQKSKNYPGDTYVDFKAD
jgi:hypothetical protein